MNLKRIKEPTGGVHHPPSNDPSLVFKTFDLGAASALICVGFELITIDKENPRKCRFVFRQKDGLQGAIIRYFADRLTVNARGYFDNIKALKSQIYSNTE